MTIYLGADHRGFALKENIKKMLTGGPHQVVDLGNSRYDADDDYPDFAEAVAKKVSEHPEEDRGIVICGSGIGVDVVANKFHGVRTALAMSPEQIESGRRDDDVNVLALAADFLKEPEVMPIVQAFFAAPYDSLERHARRIKKIDTLENE